MKVFPFYYREVILADSFLMESLVKNPLPTLLQIVIKITIIISEYYKTC